MPTGKDSVNPGGLMKVARRTRDAQARVQAAADALRSHLSHSESFATQFDEAVMREDRGAILGLIAEAGVHEDIEVTIEALEADRSITIKFCFWRICITIRFDW
jgi:ribosomal protein L16 Arg81 hydroxylase